CREAYEVFADVVSNDLGVAAASRESMSHVSADDDDAAESQEHLKGLRDRLRAEASAARPSAITYDSTAVNKRGAHAWFSRRVDSSIAATILLTVAVGSGIAMRRSAKDAAVERARSRELQSAVDVLKQGEKNDRANSDSVVVR